VKVSDIGKIRVGSGAAEAYGVAVDTGGCQRLEAYVELTGRRIEVRVDGFDQIGAR
jgi:hypothetical protein